MGSPKTVGIPFLVSLSIPSREQGVPPILQKYSYEQMLLVPGYRLWIGKELANKSNGIRLVGEIYSHFALRFGRGALLFIMKSAVSHLPRDSSCRDQVEGLRGLNTSAWLGRARYLGWKCLLAPILFD